mgnify:FL=1
MSTKQESKTTVSHLPEHGPIDENGREILLQVKNVDITFGKGDDAVKAVKNASFDIYKGETFSLVGESGSGKTTIGRAVIRVNRVPQERSCTRVLKFPARFRIPWTGRLSETFRWYSRILPHR